MAELVPPSESTLFPLRHQVANFLSAQENAELLRFALGKETSFVPTTVASASERVDASHRSSKKLAGGLGEWKPVLHDRFASLFDSASRAVGVRETDYAKIELEIVAHNDGDRFGRHLDTLKHGESGSERTVRFLSGVYYFFGEPRAFDGGELRFYPFGPPQSDGPVAEIIPQNNMAVFFPSFAAHEVLRVACPSREFAHSRFAVNCWFHRTIV